MQFEDKIKAVALNRLFVEFPTFRRKLSLNTLTPSQLFDKLWREYPNEIGEKFFQIGYHSKNELLKSSEEELIWAERSGLSLLIANGGDSDYPKNLLESFDYPILLYKKGNIDLGSRRYLSIVGTRRATSYGVEACFDIVSKVAKLFPDTVIVSGLAFGIDIEAHKAALKVGLPTVAILGCAPNQIYPASHIHWGRKIIENGALLYELPRGSVFRKFNYIRRNRVIAAISQATIVVESAEKGGALITASMANCYSREVFALPGRVGDTYSKGCNNLIANNRATIFTSVEEMANQLGWSFNQKEIELQKSAQLFDSLSEEKRKILITLQKSGELAVDTLSQLLEIEIGAILTILIELELEGLITSLPGKRYRVASQIDIEWS